MYQSGVGKLAHGHPIQIADSRLKVHLCIATSWGKDHPDIREILPRKPNSLTVRVSSAAATVALCMANEANPPKRSVLLEIAAASLLFTVTAISAAAWGSAMPCMQGDEQERTIYWIAWVLMTSTREFTTCKINVILIHLLKALIMNIEQIGLKLSKRYA